MAITKEKKKQLIELWREKVTSSDTVLVVSYQGLRANDLGRLRMQIREEGAELQVVKNRLFKMLLEDEKELSGLINLIQGATGVIFSSERGDGLNLLKRLSSIRDEFSALEIRGGILEGSFFGADKVEYLASLPSREVMLGKVLGAMQSPLVHLEYLLKSILKSFVTLMCKLKDKKGEEEGNGKEGK
ncbi:50S ribosomal protein L10 [Candidatus Calescamantes bacterium]|nr:50S ribosomal protein L10 [Candidatus Calescamantes bacterium]